MEIMKKEIFIEKFKNKFPDKFNNFDFSNLPDEINMKQKYPNGIICKKHGKIDSRLDSFLFSGKCKFCSQENYSNKGIRKISIQDFIEKCKKIYTWKEFEQRDKEKFPTGTSKYDYSITTEFRPIGNSKFEFDYICPIHGKQTQRVDTHENGLGGCIKCRHKSSGILQRLTQEEFINQCKKFHPEYNYSQVIYDGHTNEKEIKVICPKHGLFTIIAHRLSSGTGNCPYCKNSGKSKLESELYEFIKSIYNDEIIINKRNILDSNKEIDIYLPEKKIGFEFNGLLWHSEYSGKPSTYHQEKYLKALNKNIHLINIWEDDWTEKENIVKSRIKQVLNLTERKIYARNCIIKQLSIDDEKFFLIKNHLQEYRQSEICYGLFYKNELVALMSFGKSIFKKLEYNEYELIRFCTKLNTYIIGGASKLFKNFINKFKPKKIISFALADWSINSKNNLYNQLGFEFIKLTKPNYFYVTGKLRTNRISLRKQILIDKYNCPKEMSEHKFCLSMGWYKIYNTGNLLYEYK